MARGVKARSSFTKFRRAWRLTTISSPSGGRATRLAQGSEFKIAYRLNWANEWPPQTPQNKAMVRFSGGGLNAHQDRRLFVIDFAGGDLTGEIMPDVSASGGKISNIVLQPNPQIGGIAPDFRI